MITKTSIEEVLANTDMVSFVNQYVRLEKRGNDWWGCCPFHSEKTPSFKVDPEKKLFYCFGCGKGGSLFSFVQEMEKIPFPAAIEFLAKRAGIQLQFTDSKEQTFQNFDDTKDKLIELYSRVAKSFQYILLSTEEGNIAKEYLQKKNVSQEMIERFQLGFSPKDRKWLKSFLQKKGYSDDFLVNTGLFSKKYPDISFFSNRVMFPICDRRGSVIAFGGRILEGEGPKYLNSGEMVQYKKGENLFAFNLALPTIREKKSVILCEGYMDVIAYHQANIEEAVAPLGTSFTEDQAKLLRSFAQTVYLSFDSDGAGQKATYKAILLCRKFDFTVKIIHISKGKDPAEVLQNFGQEELKKNIDCAINDFEYLASYAQKKFNIETSQGKMEASRFLFPYFQILPSKIQQETCIEQAAVYFSIGYIPLMEDFKKYINSGVNGYNQISENKTVEEKNILKEKKSTFIKKTAELRAVLAITAHLEKFKEYRNNFSTDDFDDANAKEIFIALEESFREEALSYENLLEHCSSEALRNIIIESNAQGEFSNSEKIPKIIEDCIQLIKRNSLIKKRSEIVFKLRQLKGDSQSEMLEIENLMTEKNNIDAQLKAKDMDE